MEELVPWRAKIEGLANKEVGKTRVFLDGSRLACRMRECNLGNLITDAFIDQVSNRIHNESFTSITKKIDTEIID